MMPTITGTNGDDNLVGTADSDTINSLLGKDTVDGLGGSDTLVVDYSSAPIDPFAGASPANVPSIVSSNGGSFSGAVKTVDGGNFVTFANIEHLQVLLDFWHNTFILDGGALTQGATVSLDGGAGIDTLEANLSALASVNLVSGPGGTTASFGTILRFEAFRLNLTEGADNVTTGAGNDTLTGNGGDDVLNSGGGNDILSGGSGTNVLNAGDGDDSITSSGIDTVDGGSGGFNFDRWSGDYGLSTANLTLVRDRAAGTGSLSNGTTLTNIEQIMSLTTGSGNDLFTFTVSEGVTVAAGAGEDTLNLTGNGFFGTISADGAGAFRGELTNDRFSGIEHLNFVSSGFSDAIVVDAAPLLSGATLSLDAAGGIDTLTIDFTAFAGLSFVVTGATVTTNVAATLSNFEVFRISSGAGDDLVTTGNGDDAVHAGGGADVIDTADGNDLLDGGAGADAMTGGAGNDLYLVDDAGDSVTENAGQGTDEIRTSLASFSLAALANVENLAGTSAGGQSLTGNGSNNVITGEAGNDMLNGGTGADTMSGRLGDDSYFVDDVGDVVIEFANEGYDIVYSAVSYTLAAGSAVEVLATVDNTAATPLNLTGNALANYLVGNAGANILDGGAGPDQLWGRGGDDSYYADAGDDVVEYDGDGYDILYARSSYALGIGQSIEVLATIDNTATTAINLAGNALDNYIVGNAGANTLNGGGGSDQLWGREGDDSYFAEMNDIVLEYAGQGSDILYAGGSYVLAEGLSIETLATADNTATTAINLTGNELDNYVTGNAGANTLDGGTGSDLLWGRAGDDSYFVDGNDTVVEHAGQGSDIVYARGSFALGAGMSVEVLGTADNTATTAVNLTGNELANYVTGNAGANILNGGAGADQLFGRGGADSFAFTSALGGGNVDHILDFVSGTDRIALDDAIFAGAGAPGNFNPDAFFAGSAAHDLDDRIIYDQASGQLFYDADGSGAGAAVLFAIVSGAPAIAASDFTVI